MDLFEEWLSRKKESKWVKRALTDSSYKNKSGVSQDTEVNTELATYGDAIIKMCYSELLLDKCNKLSAEIEKYIGDERFVTVIAKHYKILELGLIDYDDSDQKVKKHFEDYSYEKPGKTTGGNKKESPDKRKATVVEAMIGAIYKETKEMDSIIKLLNEWSRF